MKKLINIVIFLAMLCATSFAGLPTITQLEVTDVTPGSFAVTWVTSEPSNGTLSVFASDCTTTVAGVSLVSEASDTTGNMKVTAAGLAADTAYCYQAASMSLSTSETATYPAQPVTMRTTKAVLRTMNTGTMLIPVANDLLRVPPVYLPTVNDAPDGILEVLSVDNGYGPISVLLTADPAARYFDMNNLFTAATGSTMNLTGGERVKISERHGKSNCVIDRFRRVPADQEWTQVRDFVSSPAPQDIDFNGTVNILDVLRVAGGLGSTRGDPCFNSELDVTRHDRVDQLDLNDVIGSFDARP